MGRACDHTGITANSVASVDWMVGFAIQPGRRAAAEQSDRVARLVHEIKKWQGGLMYTAIVVALPAVVMVTPVHAQVHVDIGIHFPAPPPLVAVPETPRVQYVPPVPAGESCPGTTGAAPRLSESPRSPTTNRFTIGKGTRRRPS